MLPNGLRLIVQPETRTHTVIVRGGIRTSPTMEEKAGKDGVASLASTLLDYGTTTYGRLAYQRELDKIAASVATGTDFGVDVTTSGFDRGVQLLADAELHPAMRSADFRSSRSKVSEVVASDTVPII